MAVPTIRRMRTRREVLDPAPISVIASVSIRLTVDEGLLVRPRLPLSARAGDPSAAPEGSRDRADRGALEDAIRLEEILGDEWCLRDHRLHAMCKVPPRSRRHAVTVQTR